MCCLLPVSLLLFYFLVGWARAQPQCKKCPRPLVVTRSNAVEYELALWGCIQEWVALPATWSVWFFCLITTRQVTLHILPIFKTTLGTWADSKLRCHMDSVTGFTWCFSRFQFKLVGTVEHCFHIGGNKYHSRFQSTEQNRVRNRGASTDILTENWKKGVHSPSNMHYPVLSLIFSLLS